MPQDLPGFYYDAEKNRYFPNKSPIPGSTSRNCSSASASVQKKPTKSNQAKYGCRRMGIKAVRMLHARELCGNVITTYKRKVNFQEQCHKIRASKPIIWKYQGTQRIADAALEHICIDTQTPVGLTGAEILLTGGLNGTLCFYEVGNLGERANNGVRCMPDYVQSPNTKEQIASLKSPGLIWRPTGALVRLDVSCIKISRKYYPQATDAAPTMPHVLVCSWQ